MPTTSSTRKGSAALNALAAPSTSARPGRNWRRLRIHHTRRWQAGAGKPLGAHQQDDDEHGEHRDRGEDAADQEVGGLLKQSEHQAGDDGAAVVAHAAERDRHEAVEGQQRRIGKEGEQHLAAGKARERADHAGERKARDAQVALRQAERARRIIVLGDRQKGVADQRVAIEQFEADDRRPRRPASAARTADRSRRARCRRAAETAAARCSIRSR